MHPRLLVLCSSPIDSLTSRSDHARLVAFYQSASRFCDIVMLSFSEAFVADDEVVHSPSLTERLFSTDVALREALDVLRRSGLEGDVRGLAAALAIADPDCAFGKAARGLAGDADAIVHERPFSAPAFADGSFAHKEIYRSLGLEVERFGAHVSGAGAHDALLRLMSIERSLAQRARVIFTPSDRDFAKFHLLFGVPPSRLSVRPDTIDTDGVGDDGRGETQSVATRKTILFVGSSAQPDIDAAHSVLSTADDLPAYDIVIGGPVCGDVSQAAKSDNVRYRSDVGVVADHRLWADTTLFIASSDGTFQGLKTLDALAAGVPVICTRDIAHDLRLSADVHAMVVDYETVSDAVLAMAANDENRSRLGLAGKRHVETSHNLTQVTTDYVDAILRESVDDGATSRPLVLAFNDYSVANTFSGGKARIAHLLGLLSADVVLITFGDTFAVTSLRPNLLSIAVPKTQDHLRFEASLNDDEPVSANDCAAALFVSANPIIAGIAELFACRAEAIIFEHCYLAPVLDVIGDLAPCAPIIYSAHNVESAHKHAMLADRSDSQTLVRFVDELETLLIQRAHLVICCTAADQTRFVDRGGSTLLVPNGCDIPVLDVGVNRRRNRRRALPRIGFMGSNHHPNVEAARFIIDAIAPEIPDALFEFLGALSEEIVNVNAPNVIVWGETSEREKHRILTGWELALNPISIGGGSSVKTPDFLAHGLPVVSTAIGARGFDLVGRGAGLIVDRADMAATLRLLLGEPGRLDGMAHQAYAYAKQTLAWERVAAGYDAALAAAIARSTRRASSHSSTGQPPPR